EFMGYKLGFMMHWSPGSQLSTFESWGLIDEQADWSQQEVNWTDDMSEYQKQYIDSYKTFNPIRFRPDRWAKIAKACGFKYLLFTTKHHDGFCMFDTKTTDYKITNKDCPFSSNKNADIVGSLYEEFKKQGLAISTYFSKPDWHSEYFWADGFPKCKVPNVNYDVKEYPELWEKYVQYVHAQLRELTSNYGKIDVLWLDGGGVRPENMGQDIRLGEIIGEIRDTTQPDLIVCNRANGGEFENILTPEASIPKEIIYSPWESCIPIGEHFSFHYLDRYKTPFELVTMLIEIVAKGGNLALNVPAQPDGELPEGAIRSIAGLGEWLKINGEGIYNTYACPEMPMSSTTYFTKKDNCYYMFYIYSAGVIRLPKYMLLPNMPKLKSVTLIRNGQNVPFIQSGESVKLFFDDIDVLFAKHSDCFKFEFLN
ncbi:MAG: alpha-L-fucosidase, partial [Oscillospiraceae bacterium]